ncbi:MAG TPA: hypothetical protein VMW38_25410 [Terriglobia bacterium]|nr:hypothetical protein [Terriglobia bacterium]
MPERIHLNKRCQSGPVDPAFPRVGAGILCVVRQHGNERPRLKGHAGGESCALSVPTRDQPGRKNWAWLAVGHGCDSRLLQVGWFRCLTITTEYIHWLEGLIQKGDGTHARRIEPAGKVATLLALVALVFAVLAFD